MEKTVEAVICGHEITSAEVVAFIVSKDADLTVAFEVELPELYTVTADEYEAMHSSWIKAVFYR